MASQELDKVQKTAELNRLLTTANVHRRRGDYVSATRTIKQALALDPENLDARELAADMFFAHGNLEKAAEEYKRIVEADKSRASAEEKYATAILQIAEGKRQQHLLKEMLENPGKKQVPERNTLAAAVLSGFPGLGQVYCYQIKRGIIIGVAAALFWLLFWILAPPMNDYSGLSDRVRDSVNRAAYFRTGLNAPSVFCLCAAISTHVYALVDAVVLADKINKNKNTE